MRRPWQIWLVFLSGLAVAFAAMGWLSLKALDLEQDREQSRLDAELEENVRMALGNLDYTLVMPMLAQESAWPHFAYQPYYATVKTEDKSTGKSPSKPSAAASEPIPSPLLTPTNQFVLLNFEIDPDGKFISPQCPPAKMSEWAVKNGSTPEFIGEANKRLDELKLVCSLDDLLKRLPEVQSVEIALPFQYNSNWLSGGNTYTGNTTVNGGTLNLGNSSVTFSNSGAQPGSTAQPGNTAQPNGPAQPNAPEQPNAPAQPNSTIQLNGAVQTGNAPQPNPPAQPNANPPLGNGGGGAPNNLTINSSSGGSPRYGAGGGRGGNPRGGGRAGQGGQGGQGAQAGQDGDAVQGQGGSTANANSPFVNNPALNSSPNPQQKPSSPNQAEQQQPQADDLNNNGDYATLQQSAYANPPPQQGGRQDNNRDQQTKNSIDLASRSRAFNYGQSFAQQQQRLFLDNDKAAQIVAGTTNVSQGLGKALWLDSSLVFARRVTVDGKTLIQGCVLDWPMLHDWLTDEVRATLPDAELVPVKTPADETRGRMLATLPVRLTVPAAVFVASTWYTPIRISLLVAWGCALLGGLAVAALLFGVVTLSERRGAFVSAVTHELRTPLTTFRMYAEMLSEGMIHDPVQQKHYLGTLRVEADRLTHLVGNVLAYARLERGKLSDRLQTVPVADLIARCRDRLSDRAKQAEFELVVDIDEPTLARTVRADSAAVEQILFNLVDNAGKYAATATDRRIHLEAEQTGRHVLLRVRDHGPGVCAKEAKRLFQPFRKSAKDAANSAPGVGLGLALSRRLARDLGGELTSADLSGDGACFVIKLAAVE